MTFSEYYLPTSQSELLFFFLFFLHKRCEIALIKVEDRMFGVYKLIEDLTGLSSRRSITPEEIYPLALP